MHRVHQHIAFAVRRPYRSDRPTGTLRCMSSVTFISLWQARPFRPIIVLLRDGRSIQITAPHQVAAASDLQRFVVMTGDATESFGPADVLDCSQIGVEPSIDHTSPDGAERWCDELPDLEPVRQPITRGQITGGQKTRAQNIRPQEGIPGNVGRVGSDMQPDPGRLEVMSFSTPDGHRLTQFSLLSRDGDVMLRTIGLRWNLIGVETFDNGRTLFLEHADDASRQLRLIAWPPDQATLDSYAEAQPVEAIQASIAAMDQEIRTHPRSPEPAAGYGASLIPPPPPPPAKPILRFFRGEEAWLDAEMPTLPGPEMFTLDTRAIEVRPHHWATELQLKDAKGSPVFDLFETGWTGHATIEGDAWRFRLQREGEGDSFQFDVLPSRYEARIFGQETLPLGFVERRLRSVTLYDDMDQLQQALQRGPDDVPQPECMIPLHAGSGGVSATVELWPGPHAVPTPFLQPRILGVDGEALLDLRGSAWGARIDQRSIMQLLHRDPKERFGAVAAFRLLIRPDERRCRTQGRPGFITLGRLHHLAHELIHPSMLADRLEEVFERSADLP